MGLAHSPRVSTNGLVFAFDRDNFKSYKGPAIQNIATTIAGVTYSDTGISFTSGSESVNIPGLGAMTAQTVVGYNNYPAVSSGCCPGLFYYVVGNGSVACSSSTTYTYSIVYKTQSGYTHPNFMYRYEYTAADAYVGEAGVHNASNRIHLGDGWYWAWGTFTTGATTTKLFLRYFYYNYATTSDKLWIAKVLVTPGTYTELHPRFWPDVAASKSASNTVYDLTGTNSITANSLTYAANGNFSFNGTTDYIDLGTTTQLINNFTCSFWHKGTNIGYILDQGNLGIDLTGCIEVTGYGLAVTSNNGENVVADGYATFSSANWNNIVFTFASGVVNFYINGALDSTKTFPTITSFTPGGSILKIGRRAFNTTNALTGQVANVSIYNRVLSAAEIRQNFNALRGRFGV